MSLATEDEQADTLRLGHQILALIEPITAKAALPSDPPGNLVFNTACLCFEALSGAYEDRGFVDWSPIVAGLAFSVGAMAAQVPEDQRAQVLAVLTEWYGHGKDDVTRDLEPVGHA